MAEVENYKLACLSTSHLEKATAEAMENDNEQFGYPIGVFEQGFFVSCQLAPDVPGAGVHYSLDVVRQWARANGFMYVLLDRDAEPVEGLPVYDW